MINIEQTIIEARQYCFANNLTQKQYLHRAGMLKSTSVFHSYTGMYLSSFIAFIRPLGKSLYVDGLRVATLDEAKKPILTRIGHLTPYGKGLRLCTSQSGVKSFLHTSGDTQLKVYFRYCQKLNIKLEIK